MINLLNKLRKNKIIIRVTACLMVVLVLVSGSIGITFQTAYAIAGVDDALISILVGFLCGCGMTFSSQSLADNTALSFYNRLSAESRTILQEKVQIYQTLHATDPVYNLIWNGDELSTLISDFFIAYPQAQGSFAVTYNYIANICGDSSTYDTIKNMYETDNSNISVPFGLENDDYFTFLLSENIELSVMGKDIFLNQFGTSVYDALFVSNLTDYTATGGGSYHTFLGHVGGADHFGGVAYYTLPGTCLSFVAPLAAGAGSMILSYNGGDPNIYFPDWVSTDLFGQGVWLFNNEICNTVMTWSSSLDTYLLRITSPTYGDIVCDADGSIFGSDSALGRSICPDGVNIRADRLVRWLLGDDVISQSASVPKVPSISDVYNPSNDTYWQDVASNPTAEYPWSIPMDTGRTISTSVPQIRSRDLATDTTADPDAGSGENDDTNNSRPHLPVAPLPSDLTIPEIIFMRKFPFCLPYDLYNVFSQFYAEQTEAPVFEFPFKFERLNIDYTFRLDLAEYRTIINLNKTFINIAFVVGLIYLSRKLIGAQ